tara:strand:- start:1614 stop:2081 length:468 start_codon:yes stop_codon:yes gene_type:complete
MVDDEIVYSDCRIQTAIPEFDAVELYQDMRTMDMLEVIGLGHHPRLALEESYKRSTKAWSVCTSEFRMVASFGVCPSDKENVGIPWLLGTHRMHLIKKTFIKHSKEWIERMMGDYDVLTNVVMTDNKLSMRWLVWLGAIFEECSIDGYKQFKIYK